MTSTLLAPPLTASSDLQAVLKEQGFAVVAPDTVSALSGVSLAELSGLNSFWNDLPPDQYLKDGGRYRRRRHASFLVQDGVVSQYAHRAHWQPLSYNALHGGMRRWFEPLDVAMTSSPAWPAVISFLGRVYTNYGMFSCGYTYIVFNNWRNGMNHHFIFV